MTTSTSSDIEKFVNDKLLWKSFRCDTFGETLKGMFLSFIARDYWFLEILVLCTGLSARSMKLDLNSNSGTSTSIKL